MINLDYINKFPTYESVHSTLSSMSEEKINTLLQHDTDNQVIYRNSESLDSSEYLGDLGYYCFFNKIGGMMITHKPHKKKHAEGDSRFQDAVNLFIFSIRINGKAFPENGYFSTCFCVKNENKEYFLKKNKMKGIINVNEIYQGFNKAMVMPVFLYRA